MSRAPHPQTPDRIELPNGCYWLPYDGRNPDDAVEGCVFSKDDIIIVSHVTPFEAQQLAAAMGPVEASPLPGDEEAAEKLVSDLDGEGFIQSTPKFRIPERQIIIGAVALAMKNHREQATTPLRKAAHAALVKLRMNRGGGDIGSILQEVQDLEDVLAAHSTNSEAQKVNNG